MTHYHVACEHGLEDVAKKFLDHGQVDPDLPVPETDDSPLHLALRHRQTGVVRSLLEAGADPLLCTRLTDTSRWSCSSGSTTTCWKRCQSTPSATATWRKCCSRSVTRDCSRCGSTLGTGRAGHRCNWPWRSSSPTSRPRHSRSAATPFVACYWSEGYDLDPSDALTIMKLFVEHELCGVSADRRRAVWYDDESFAVPAKKRMTKPPSQLSMYDLIRSTSGQAAKLFERGRDYGELCSSGKLSTWRLVPGT
ncbi:hypothetical protein TKK_0006571 [Trichogramma kaykai]